MDAEMDSIRSKEDIVSLHNGREWATFDGGIETLIGQTDRLLQRIFRTTNPPLLVRLFFFFFFSSSRCNQLSKQKFHISQR